MIHILTGEYPPMPGGVSDYTAQVAAGLADLGEDVRVWRPGDGTIKGRFRPEDLDRLDAALANYAAPRRLLVQWVPHAFGPRALNFHFVLWLWRRAHRHKDVVQLMVHEPFVAFEGSLRQRIAACLHRAMAVILLDAASQVWVSIPAWEQRLRPWAIRRNPSFAWLPVPSNIPPSPRLQRSNATPLIGHFGTYGKSVTALLEPLIGEILDSSDANILLAGNNSDRLLKQLTHPEAATRIHATGALPARELSRAVASCDLMLQPYPDGISTRRGSAMCALALGIPLVSNLGHLSEPFWKETDAARIAPTPAGCGKTVLELLRDQPLRQRTSAAARKLYEENFHLRHTLSAFRSTRQPERARKAIA